LWRWLVLALSPARLLASRAGIWAFPDGVRGVPPRAEYGSVYLALTMRDV
jgi:hypothetical protein